MTSLTLPAGLPLAFASWEQTLLLIRQLIVQLLTVIQQQTARIAYSMLSCPRTPAAQIAPPSSNPPFVTRPSSLTAKGTPGAKSGHPGHHQALLALTSVDVVAELPRNPNGKVLKWVLREPYWTGHQWRVAGA